MDYDSRLNERQTITCLQRIPNILLINGGFLDNPGLYSGETGLVLFFFRYARFTQNEIYSDYSFDLIEKIQTGINKETPIDYKKGLTGVGSAIEYLVQTGFVKSSTDYLLDDFDKQLFSSQNMPSLPFDDLLGIGYYAFWRITGNSSKKDMIRKTILPQVVDYMEKKCGFKHLAVSFFRNIISPESDFVFHDESDFSALKCLCCKNNPCRLESETYSRIFEQISERKYFNANILNLGIESGLAGLGLALLTELDGDDSWTSLFPNDLFQSAN